MEMSSGVLVDLLRGLADSGIEFWLDGGWGVDALVGTQTRPHKDVDLIVPVEDVPRVQEVLGARGFTCRRGSPPDSFVLADDGGLEVDIHAVVFNGSGAGVYRMENGRDWIYPAEGFSGRGVVGGLNVHCLSPKAQVLCHVEGYIPVEKDFRDMELLHARFGVKLPPDWTPTPGR
jgi:lincosamide nucleotidyltransferase A/C/D/E